MKRVATIFVFAIALLAATPTEEQSTTFDMVKLAYHSHGACEMMGRLEVQWFDDVPQTGEMQGESPKRAISTAIGPDTRCGIEIWVPTRTDRDGYIAATIFAINQEDTLRSVVYGEEFTGE